MRRTGCVWILAGIVGLAGTLQAAERDTYQSAKAAAAESKARADAERKKSSWWSSLWPFGADEPKNEVKVEKVAKPKEPPKPRPVAAPLGAEGVNLITREQSKFLRRQQVCDRIRDIAQQKGDAELEKQAQLLEQRAWFIYEQRTAQARVPSLLPIGDDPDAAKLLTPGSRSKKVDDPAIHSITNRSPSKED
jgi:hypothetical protein